MLFRLPIGLAGSLILALLAGCSTQGPKIPEVVAVTGEVTYQGKGVEGAEVIFTPASPDSKPGRGLTGSDGKFSLKSYVDAEHDLTGAIPGDYKVLVSKKDLPKLTAADMANMGGRPAPAPKDLLPAKYADVNQTTLTATVKPKEKNDFKFELTD